MRFQVKNAVFLNFNKTLTLRQVYKVHQVFCGVLKSAMRGNDVVPDGEESSKKQ